jgi:hypothetical protein
MKDSRKSTIGPSERSAADPSPTTPQRYSALLALLFLAGCPTSPDLAPLTENVGRVVDAQLIPTSFNESIKTQIKTEKRYMVVYGTVNVRLGDEATLVTSGRTQCLQFSYSAKCYRVAQ